MIRAISYGGGVQSTALLVLAAQRRIDYPVIVMANVGDDSEHPATLRYVREVAMPYAEREGIELHIVDRVRRDGTVETLWGRLMREGSRSLPIPVRMSNGAPGTRSCTVDFKIKVIGKFLKQHGATAADPAQVAIGISLDEIHRANNRRAEAHERIVYPLVSIGDDTGLRLRRDDCTRIIAAAGLPVPPKSSCFFCLAGETEVVTRQGIRPIAELAGQRLELLVPKIGTQGGLSEVGSWQEVQVHELGVQRLHRVSLRRGRSVKVIRATAEHRWLLRPRAQREASNTLERTTAQLRAGDQLKDLRATPVSRETISPVGVAHGFTWGDGTRPQGRRGSTLTVYDNGKDVAILPFFAAFHPTKRKDGHWQILGLPRAWKALPDLTEHRGYLLGWLAGLFAADGTVGRRGASTLYGSEVTIRAARDVCALLGIRYSPIREKAREITLSGRTYTLPLWSLNLDRRTLPDGFFLVGEHASRAGMAPTDSRRPSWTVVSVETTDDFETVYCPEVPGAGAFGLADDLMTGNCPFHRPSAWQDLARDEPELFARSVQLEETLNARRGALGKDPVFLTRFGVPLRDAVAGPEQQLLPDDACDSGWCHT